MIRNLSKPNRLISALIFLSILMTSLPLILFGVPGFYGDDFNMLGSLEIGDGIIGSVQLWISEYGLVYRPFGALFLNSVYGFFGHSESLIYGISLLIYSFFILVVFKSAKVFTNDNALALFVTLSFSSFPFNPTAFLQISSIYMMFTGLSSLLLMLVIYRKQRSLRLKELTLIAIIWIMLLLSYEQITGLVAVMFYLIFTENKRKGVFQSFKISILSNSLIIIATLVFMIFFFLSSNNPKVKTISDLNQITQEKIMNEDLVNQIDKVDQEKTNTFSASRLDALISKFERSSSFLYENFSYSLENILENEIKGFLLLISISLTIFLIFLYPIRGPSREFALKQVTFGLIWAVSTLSPFFLYKSVHIPPYVLLIPSIGLVYFLYGIFWLLPFPRKGNIPAYLFKTFFALLFLSFQIQQYGYYFGLKEELAYWNMIADEFNQKIKETDQNGKIQIKTIDRSNKHIFWIEKSIGLRHFSNLIEHNQVDYMIERLSDSTILISYQYINHS